MSDIEPIRLLHEFDKHFRCPDNVRELLLSQVSDHIRQNVARFERGFAAEDLFDSVFSSLPWCILLHNLDERQLPDESKAQYQVPDSLCLIETSSKKHCPLLVDVKGVAEAKRTLTIQKRQNQAVQQYATSLGIPFVYAVYWGQFGAWTINTSDVFDEKATELKLSVESALVADCSLLFGDISFLIDKPLQRTTTFSKSEPDHKGVEHQDYGKMLREVITYGGNSKELNILESLAMDATFDFKDRNVDREGGVTTVHAVDTELQLVRISTSVTRQLGKIDKPNDIQAAQVAAKAFVFLLRELNVQGVMVYPQKYSPEVKTLWKRFVESETAS